jgi:hypothetical protein
MSSTIASRTVRFAALAALAVGFASLTGCASGINTMNAPATSTRVSRFGAFPIDDPSPVTAGSNMPAVIGRGYGYMGG